MKTLMLTSLLLPFVLNAKEFDVIIKNVTVISPLNPYQASVADKHWVGIQDDKIKTISAKALNDADANVIDGTDKFLIPGLMDAHVHLNRMPGLPFELSQFNEKEIAGLESLQLKYQQRQGKNYLYYGVTQVLEPGASKESMSLFQSNGVAPNSYFCGAVPIYQGYNAQDIDYKQLHEKRPYYVHQHGDPSHLHDKHILERHSSKQLVQRMADDGAICTKVYLEDGFGKRSDIPLIASKTLDELKAASEKHGLKMMAHANATDMQRLGLTHQLDVMAHGNWNWLDERRVDTKDELPPQVKAVADDIIRSGVVYQPTLNVMRALTDVMREDHITQPDYEKVLSEAQIAWYQTEAGQWFAREMKSGWGNMSDAQKIARFEFNQQLGKRVLNYIYKNGGIISLATDTPPAPTYASQPGLATYWELKDMHDAGMSLTSILAAATLNNAKAFSLDKQYGTVEVDKVANLLLLNSNPLQSVEAYNQIDSVILNGVPLLRADLEITK
jgi:imidazolonepropionase-like amidohydrolase